MEQARGGVPNNHLVQPNLSLSQRAVSSDLAREEGRNLFQKTGKLDRLGVIVITARRQRLFAIARHSVRRQRNHRNVLRPRVSLKPPCCLPAVNHRQA